MNFNSRRSNVRATNGMVATTQPLAAAAGVRAMMQGGNAVDAAVTAAAVLNVVEPHSTGIGGDLFALVWNAKDRRLQALNACGRSPGQASLQHLRNMGLAAIPDQSPFSVTVPGAVSGWETLLDHCGKVELRDALQPAIQYAENGFPVSEVISDHWQVGAPRLAAGPGSGELLLNGSPPLPGEIMKVPTLAESLRTVAEGGSDAFYTGPLAAKICDFVQSIGGWLSVEDMGAHESTWVEPISANYRGFDCWQCPPPSQGVNALLALSIAEGFDISRMGFQTADTYHHLIESMRLAFADSLYYVTDPESMPVAAGDLLSKKYASERRSLITSKRALSMVAHGLTSRSSQYCLRLGS